MPTMTTTPALPTGTWTVDPTRSRVEFQLRQFGVATVRGAFETFEGTLQVGVDPADVRVSGSVSVASIDTKQHRRDDHLRSADFFDVEQFPTLTFASHEIRRLDDTFEIAGHLTLRGVTREITLAAELLDPELGFPGQEHLLLEAHGRLDRTDYGVTPNPLLNVLVSDQVELELRISAVKQA
jgi:polyisoprenoid-binding protein YceI